MEFEKAEFNGDIQVNEIIIESSVIKKKNFLNHMKANRNSSKKEKDN